MTYRIIAALKARHAPDIVIQRAEVALLQGGNRSPHGHTHLAFDTSAKGCGGPKVLHTTDPGDSQSNSYYILDLREVCSNP